MYGKPLQDLYKKLSNYRQAPTQAEIIEDLESLLQQKGLSYHPRSIKRQLLGHIEYVPEALESALVTWLRRRRKPIYKKWLRGLERQKKAAQKASQAPRYIAPEFFIRMAEGYLNINKNLSPRQLATLLQKKLRKKQISLGLKTLQAALTGKTPKIRRELEEELKVLYSQEGYRTTKQIENLLKKLNRQAQGSTKKPFPAQKQRNQYVDAQSLPKMIQAILKKLPFLTRRQLALMLREDLQQRSFDFSLNTLQYILAGKTQRTRGVVLEVLNEYQKPGVLEQLWAERKNFLTGKKGRPSADTKVVEALAKLNQAQRNDRDELYSDFLEARQDLIRKRLSQQNHKKSSTKGSKSKSVHDILKDIEPGDPFSNEGTSPEDAVVAYDVGSGIDRLVS